jgi:hypothetical protein
MNSQNQGTSNRSKTDPMSLKLKASSLNQALNQPVGLPPKHEKTP